MSNRGSVVVFLVLALTGSEVGADETSIETLRQRCEAAREAKIAPLRAAAIEDCVNNEKKDPTYCERFYADFGAGGRTAAGAARERMFNDLPECLELYEAEKTRTRP